MENDADAASAALDARLRLPGDGSNERRQALSVTEIELQTIAAAASAGDARPPIATGRAMRL